MIQQQVDSFIALVAAIYLFYALSLLRKQLKRRRHKTWRARKRKSQLRLLKKSSFAPSDKSNFASKNLLNYSEKHFFKILSDALPDYYIFPQVSFNALITHASWILKDYWKHFVRMNFNTKYVDFVLCRKADFKVVAIVEYDGSGHRNHDDVRRDALLKNVGYRVERFTSEDTAESVSTRFKDFTAAQANTPSFAE
jgi:hypothetical protein